jgi:hypothetical protein
LQSSVIPKSKIAQSIHEFEKKIEVERKFERQEQQMKEEMELLEMKKSK